MLKNVIKDDITTELMESSRLPTSTQGNCQGDKSRAVICTVFSERDKEIKRTVTPFHLNTCVLGLMSLHQYDVGNGC